ncbi:MAG: energy transducer TonB, partial [Bacteroidota bacterium]
DTLTLEKLPTFNGGSSAFANYLIKKIHYPTKAKVFGIQGQVFLQFFVEKTGEINEVKVIKGLGYGCDEEAVRALKASPKWLPGMANNRPVRTSVTVPIKFRLVDDSNEIVYRIDEAYYIGLEGTFAAETLKEKIIQADTLNPHQAWEQHHLKVRKHFIVIKIKE